MAFSKTSNFVIRKKKRRPRSSKSSGIDPLKLFLYTISSIISGERNKRWWGWPMISRVAAATWNEAKNAAGPNSREIIASVFPLPSFFSPSSSSSHLIHQIEKAGINNVVDANHSLADLRASRSSLHLAARTFDTCVIHTLCVCVCVYILDVETGDFLFARNSRIQRARFKIRRISDILCRSQRYVTVRILHRVEEREEASS